MFHVRRKGIQIASIDKTPSVGAALPSKTETAKILEMFNKEILPLGRI